MSLANQLQHFVHLSEHLTVRQVILMAHIRGAQDQTQIVVSRSAGVSPPAVSRNISKLEGLGLVIRTTSREDKRMVRVRLSPAGHRLMAAAERVECAQ